MNNFKKMIGIHVIAFFVGRVELCFMYPFLTAFFMAAYLEGASSMSLFAVLLLGVASTLRWSAVAKYCFVILGIVVLLALMQKKYLGEHKLLMAFVAGIMTFIGGVGELYMAGSLFQTPYLPVLEGVIAGCATIVFARALSVILHNVWDVMTYNDALISVLCLLTCGIFGMPYTVGNVFSVMGLAIYLAICYGGFCGGVSLGTCVGVAGGILMAYQTGQIESLGALVLLGLAIGVCRESGKIGSLLGMIMAYGLLGVLYQPQLLEVEQLRASISAAVLFMMTPKKYLYQPEKKDYAGDANVSGRILEECGQQLKDLGAAFSQLAGNFLVYNQNGRVPAYADGVPLEPSGSRREKAASESQEIRYHERMLKERNVMLKQMETVGEIVEEYAKQITPTNVSSKNLELRIKKALWTKDIHVNKLAVYHNSQGRKRIYLYVYNTKEHVVTAKEVSKLVGAAIKKKLILDKDSRSIVAKEETLLIMEEAPNFTYRTGYLCTHKQGESLCGDSTYMNAISKEKMVLMISDGMGSGETAYRQSEFLTDSAVEMLSAGFGQQQALMLLNALISLKYQGESFATLDLCSVDLYTGMAEFVKYGAATTFIKRDEWIETIQSTSLPLGALEEVDADVTSKKLFHKDVVIMCSDGFLDCVGGEDKIARMKEYILGLNESGPQEMAAQLYKKVMRSDPDNKAEGNRDDATILVFQLEAA